MDDDYESWLSQTDPNYESALPQQQQQQTAMPSFSGLGGFGAFSMPMAGTQTIAPSDHAALSVLGNEALGAGQAQPQMPQHYSHQRFSYPHSTQQTASLTSQPIGGGGVGFDASGKFVQGGKYSTGFFDHTGRFHPNMVGFSEFGGL